MKRISGVLMSLAAACAPALAQAGWYAGFSFGQSNTSRDLVENRESTVTLGADFHTAFDDRDRALKATVGYAIRPWLSIEASYADLGEHRLVMDFQGGDPPSPARVTLAREVTGAGADVVLSYPFGPGASVFGRAGAYRVRLKARTEIEGNVVFNNGDPGERKRTTVRDETVPKFGAGVQLPIHPDAWVRVEWERYRKIGKAFEVGGSGTTGEADTDAFLAGFVFRF